MCPIQRACPEHLLTFVRTHPVFDFMRDGIANGKILPCVRKNEIHFYEGGARLFRFTSQSIYTDNRYIDGKDGGERRLSVTEQSSSMLGKVRKNAQAHRQTKLASELAAVHSLFPHFSFARSAHKPSQLAIVDVEARFGLDPKSEITGSQIPGRMIDLVFLMPNRLLLFIEAKCMGNADIASTGHAEVEKQVADCERHISHACVLDAFNDSIKAQMALLGKDAALATATGIFCRVPVLLLDPPGKGAIGPRNTWLPDRLREADDWTVDDERPVVIDGRGDKVVAVREFVDKFAG